MKTMRKLVSLILAIMMIAAVGAAYGVSDLNTSGDNISEGRGTQGQGHSNAAILAGESVNIQKALVVYNVDTIAIFAPTISYSYAITPGSNNKQITDSQSTKALTKTGKLKGLKVTGVAAGGSSATTTATASDETSVGNTISWNSTENVNAGTDGVVNTKNLVLDFSGVDFGAAGVYRYVITETCSAANYTAAGVTETTTEATTGDKHVRYLDVYVKDNSDTTQTGANAWDVYGFACFYQDSNITSDATTSVGKTTGFVDGTADGTNSVNADKYYTHNVTVSKTLTGDKAMDANQFPMTIIHTNTSVNAGTQLKTTVSNPNRATDYTRGVGASIAGNGLNGVATIANGESIKYIGIPNGTSTTIYETNNVVGTSYRTIVTPDSASANAKVISWTATAPTTTSSAAGHSNEAYQSNTATIAGTAYNVDDDTNHTIAVTNALELISPTGVVLRVAPYLLMLAAGITLLVIFMVKRRKHTEED